MFEREVYSLNWKGKAVVLLLAPIALAGAFIRTFFTELAVAIWRACWEVRWEWMRIRMDFLR